VFTNWKVLTNKDACTEKTEIDIYVPKLTVPIFCMYRKWLCRYWHWMYRNWLYRKKCTESVCTWTVMYQKRCTPPRAVGKMQSCV